MIESTRSGDILILTIDRPEKANALTRSMLTQLTEAVEAAGDARVLLITGRGDSFSAGGDLEEIRTGGLGIAPEWERLSAAVEAFDGLSIAAINGPAIGGALGMVLACDLRVGAPEARFFYPVMRLGQLPPASDPARLKALVGPSKAKLLLMAGAKLGAEDALTIGLVDHLADDPLAASADLARDVLEGEAGHVAKIKAMI